MIPFLSLAIRCQLRSSFPTIPSPCEFETDHVKYLYTSCKAVWDLEDYRVEFYEVQILQPPERCRIVVNGVILQDYLVRPSWDLLKLHQGGEKVNTVTLQNDTVTRTIRPHRRIMAVRVHIQY
jgi:hypothetical protein